LRRLKFAEAKFTRLHAPGRDLPRQITENDGLNWHQLDVMPSEPFGLRPLSATVSQDPCVESRAINSEQPAEHSEKVSAVQRRFSSATFEFDCALIDISLMPGFTGCV
jgi:hypothetical protein